RRACARANGCSPRLDALPRVLLAHRPRAALRPIVGDPDPSRHVESVVGARTIGRLMYRTILLPSWTVARPTSVNPRAACNASEAGFGGAMLTSHTTRS